MAEVGKRTSSSKTRWHYTNEEGAAAILREGVIRPSTSQPGKGDVALGEGVYMTEKSPHGKTTNIAKNNWDGAYGQALEENKADRAIGFKLTEQAEKKLQTHRIGDRRVDLYKDMEGLNLRDDNVVKKGSVRVFDRVQHQSKQVARKN